MCVQTMATVHKTQNRRHKASGGGERVGHTDGISNRRMHPLSHVHTQREGWVMLHKKDAFSYFRLNADLDEELEGM